MTDAARVLSYIRKRLDSNLAKLVRPRFLSLPSFKLPTVTLFWILAYLSTYLEYRSWWGNLKARDHFEDLGKVGTIILKCIWKE